MKNSEEIMKRMDDMIKELGMEETMDRMLERFTNNFMISGEVTGELKEALQRAPQELLDMIWDKIVGEKPAEEVDRARKEEMLYQAIPEDLQKNIVYLDPDKLKLLIRVACGIPFDIMYTATVNEEFVPRGWVFNFIKDGECVQVVMCRTDFADIQNKKECGGNRQWQRRFMRNWAADTKSREII